MKKHILALALFLAMGWMGQRVHAQVSVGISVHIAPPVIPVYEQPLCPVDGYIWVPGYWGYGDDGYYWVPGYWDAPPEIGFLWTPGYWGYAGGVYMWNAGYWGPHVGYYGGINYGFGYGGHGYYGGEWAGGHFRYNTAITRVNTSVVHNTYVNRTVINNTTVNRVSYNGGPGGVNVRPNAQEESAMHEHHVERTTAQVQHQQTASHDRNQFASVNHGRPANAAVSRPMTSDHAANASGNRATTTTPGRPNGAATPGATHSATANRINHTHSTMNTPNNTGNGNNRPNTHSNHATVHNTNPAMNHAPRQQVNRVQPQPQVHTQGQVHAQPHRQVTNHQQPPVAHAAPHPAPHGGGGGGGERHHP